MRILNSIKLRLTLWYSSFVLAFCTIFVIVLNILLTNQVQNEPVNQPRFLMGNPQMMQTWEELTQERRDLIQDYREQDLVQFRQISALSLIPLSILSFAGGYFIAAQSLKPLQKLNKQIKQINTQNLNQPIEHKDNGDEISELIKNFNTMIARLDKSFQAQKQFVENASHELKTPLAIIQTNLDAATIDGSVSKKEILELIKVSTDSAEFMNKLIEDLLLLAVLENDIEMDKTSLTDIVDSAIESLDSIANKSKIKITHESKGKPTKVKANSILLQRAIMNIIENGLKYSPTKTSIEIDTTFYKSNVQVSIKDQGEGIPKTEQKRIFDRFYRIDKSRSRKTGGTGLGLSIVKKIIEAHKGEVEVESKKGKGTTFVIILPIIK